MPRPGGESDKVGNSFERWWTAAMMLELLRDEDGVICLEPPGSDGDGIEFWRERRGIREVHQVKRQLGFEGCWTLPQLRQRGIVGSLKRHLSDPLVQAHFVSTLSVEHLKELTERARSSPSSAAFICEYLAAEQGRAAFTRFRGVWRELTEDDARDLLRRIHVRTLGEEDLRGLVGAHAALWFDATAEVVADGLASFAWDNLARELRPADIWVGLQQRGIAPRPAHDRASLAFALAEVTATYLAGGNSIGGHRLTRPEVEEITDALHGDLRVAWIIGDAGAGKSEVARDITRRLAESWPVLALRVDRLEPAPTPIGVGVQLGLKLGPAEALAAAAHEGDALLIIDQLDAISLVSGRRSGLLDVVRSILHAVRHHPRLRVIVVCRKFDLENDYRLRDWNTAQSGARTWTVGSLDPAVVRDLVATVGYGGSLTDDQLRILALPLHLSLLADIVAAGIAFSAFSTPAHLFEEYVRRKRHAIRSRELPDEWDAVVERLVRQMTERESLSAPWRILSAREPYAQAMVSEHVLVREDGRVAFFHEALFDYLFGLRFDEGAPLADWLRGGEQALFRRAQLRQVLAFRRDEAPTRYRQDLRDLLLGSGVRFHVKHLVLGLLGRVADPTEAEATVLREYLATSDARHARHALYSTRGARAWFPRLQAPLHAMLEGDDHQRREALWWLMPLVEWDPDAVVAFLRPYIDAGPEWTPTLAWFVSWCHGYTGAERFVRTVVDLIERGGFDEAAGPRELWSTLGYASKPVVWSGAAAIAIALLRREITQPGDDVRRTRRTTHGAEKVLRRLAAEDAGGFLSSFLPLFLDACVPLDDTDPASGLALDAIGRLATESVEENPWSALVECVIEAVVALVGHDDPRGDDALQQLAGASTWTANVTVARIYARLGARRADGAVSWLLGNLRRLELDHWMRGAWSEELLRSISPHAAPGVFAWLEAAVSDYSPAYELQRGNRRQRGRARWRLLSSMPITRLSPTTRRRLAALNRRFGTAKPASFGRPIAYAVVSPIDTEVSRTMSDAEWLSAMDRYPDERLEWNDDGRPSGGARELANELQARAVEDPSRFAALAEHLSDQANPSYARAFLGGITRGGLDVVVLERVVLRLHRLPGQPVGREIVDLIKTNAGLPWSPAILETATWYAVDSPDPDLRLWDGGGRLGERVWTTGVNSVRGAAAECLGVLVEADATRLPGLLPAIRSVVTDPAESVRACAAVACIGVLRHDAALALTLAECLFDLGGSALAAPPVERLLWYLVPAHVERLLPVLERLVASDIPEVALAGARQATLAGLNNPSARPLAVRCLQGPPAVREGAATILAANVGKAAHQRFCEDSLARLFADEAPEVRKAAAGTFRGPGEPNLDKLRALAITFVKSPAFREDMDGLLMKVEASTADCAEIIVLAGERFLDVFGDDAGNMQTHAAFTAHQLRTLIVRAYGQTEPGSELRRPGRDRRHVPPRGARDRRGGAGRGTVGALSSRTVL